MSLYKGNNLISGAMPNSANQSLSNLDSAGQNIIDGKVDLDYSNADYQPVNKAGDTMTGVLHIISTDPRIKQSNTGVTKGTAPSATNYMGYTFNDKNANSASHYYETRLGMIELQSLTDGTERIVIAPYRNVANSTDMAQFIISMPQSGSGYCTLPNTTCCDGQFVNKTTQIMSRVSLNGSSNLTYTLSDLPNDGHSYLVWLSATAVTGTTSENYVFLQVYSDAVANNLEICATRTRTASSVGTAGNVVIPVSSSRKIYVIRNTSYNGTADLWLKGYRRIGTNS